MKKQSLLVSIIVVIEVLSINFISAQAGGGGYFPCTREDYCPSLGSGYYCDNNTGGCRTILGDCLEKNCNYFCKKYDMDNGTYYEKDKCWCEDYEYTTHGRIVSRQGWIQIKECTNNRQYKQIDLTYLYLIIFSLCMLIIGICLGMYFKGILIKNKKVIKR